MKDAYPLYFKTIKKMLIFRTVHLIPEEKFILEARFVSLTRESGRSFHMN